jgi:hypothetical protein
VIGIASLYGAAASSRSGRKSNIPSASRSAHEDGREHRNRALVQRAIVDHNLHAGSGELASPRGDAPVI